MSYSEIPMEKPRNEGRWCKEVVMVLENMTVQDKQK
jgi:hypothetical protein